MRILIINGPNLNLLGRRDPKMYGTRSMEQVLLDIQRAHLDIHIEYRQSNHEGDLIDWIQEYAVLPPLLHDEPCQGIVINAGGYTHTSVALRDAVACASIPVIEVHISDITTREPFRHTTLLKDVCAHTIIGHGTDGYLQAVDWLIHQTRTKNEKK